MFSRQVELELVLDYIGDSPGFIQTYVCWIPEQFAKVGKFICINELSDTMEWRVIKVFPNRKPTKELEIRSRDYTKQRKASDI